MTNQTNAQTDYRYVGANPNNYVCLEENGECTDEELYRIIGVIPTQSTKDGNYESRVKLISNTSYGSYPWSGSADVQSSDWTKSTVNTEILNTEYWGKISAYQQYIDPAKWYLGYVYWNSTYLSDYNSERENTFTIANMGIIYASDYGFATGGNDLQSRNACLKYNHIHWNGDYSYCNQNNWLYSKVEKKALLARNGDSIIWNTGPEYEGDYCSGLCTSQAYTKLEVYPSFYLKTGVKYLSGTGAKNDPIKVQ